MGLVNSIADYFTPNYSPVGATDYSGAVNSSEPIVDTPPDASGGSGSFLANLQGTLTSGINTLLSEKISNALSLQNARDLQAVNAVGKPAPKAAPVVAGKPVTTWVIIGGAAIGLYVLYRFARKV
jgi:hypothetical protein